MLKCQSVLMILAAMLISLACSGAEEASPRDDAPANATASDITRRVSIGSGAWRPVTTVESLLRSYPVVLVGTVESVIQPFDPRPEALGLSQEEIDALESGPKGGPLPSDVLSRPPGSASSIYSVKVVRRIQGDVTGPYFALMQPGGVFESVAYEYEGDPVVSLGSTYLFFLAEFDWRASGYQLPDGYDKLDEDFQTIYQAPAFGRFLVDSGSLDPVDPRWEVGCASCDVLSLHGRSVSEAAALITDASLGKPLPSPVLRTPIPAVAQYVLPSVSLDVDSSGNTANYVDNNETCASPQQGEKFIVDLTVRGVPDFDGDAYEKGIAGFGVTLQFDPEVLAIDGVNPEGDGNTILASDGERIGFEVIDTDGTLGPPTTWFPAEKGYLRIDMVDASQSYENGDGVLVRLIARAVGPGATAIEISQLAIYDAAAHTYEVAAIASAKVVVGGQCT